MIPTQAHRLTWDWWNNRVFLEAQDTDGNWWVFHRTETADRGDGLYRLWERLTKRREIDLNLWNPQEPEDGEAQTTSG